MVNQKKLQLLIWFDMITVNPNWLLVSLFFFYISIFLNLRVLISKAKGRGARRGFAVLSCNSFRPAPGVLEQERYRCAAWKTVGSMVVKPKIWWTMVRSMPKAIRKILIRIPAFTKGAQSTFEDIGPFWKVWEFHFKRPPFKTN